MSALDVLNQLYDSNHGVSLVDITAPSLGAKEQVEQRWEQIWRALDFDSLEPNGSSRLMDVAMVLSSANGHAEMLRALFRVVGTPHPVNTAFEYFLKQLCTIALVHRKELGSAFDLLPVPESMTARQAYLIIRFWWELDSYSMAEKVRLRLALADQVVELIALPAV